MTDGKMHPSLEALLEDARLLGWAVASNHGSRSGNGAKGYRLMSPLRSDIMVDIDFERQINDGRRQSMIEKVRRYSDPDKVEQLDRRRAREAQEHEARKRQVQEDADKVLQEAQERAQQTADTSKPRAANAVLTYSKEPRVVKEQPWVVRCGRGKGGTVIVYDSKMVIMRSWDDGRRNDFKCVACEYHNSNPRSVSSHYPVQSRKTHPLQKPITSSDKYSMLASEYVAYTPRTEFKNNRGQKAQSVPHETPPPLPPLELERQRRDAEQKARVVDFTDAVKVLDQIRALVLPEESEQEIRLRREVAELRELLDTAEEERAEAITAKQAAEKSADRTATALRNLKQLLAGIED